MVQHRLSQIKKHIPDEEADANLKRTIAHGIANAALALAKGENVAAQATGAMTGEAGRIYLQQTAG